MTLDQLVLVTGGSRGLGLAIVRDLLDRGYAVATCSRERGDDLARIEDEFGSRFLWLRADLSAPGQAGEFVDAAISSVDVPIYGLVNSAGIAGEGILPTFPMADARRILEVNVMGAVECSRSYLRHIVRARTAGRIVNISSILGSRGYNGLSVYAASKAALDGFTRGLAREWGRTGTTVNSVAPGYLETDMSASLAQAQREQIIRRTPMHRLGTTDDVVPVVRFLLSEESRFITGQTIVVDGGVTV